MDNGKGKDKSPHVMRIAFFHIKKYTRMVYLSILASTLRKGRLEFYV